MDLLLDAQLWTLLQNRATISGVGALTVIVTCFFLNQYRTRGPQFPPGPRGLPIIGAVLEMPKDDECFTYTRWKNQYGPIVGVHVLGQPIILLNTPRLSQELLNSRNGIYSYRPPFPMMDLMKFTGWNIGILQTGSELHSLTRRLMAQFFSQGGITRCSQIQQREAQRFLKDLLYSPDNFFHHTRRLVTANIMRCLYGLNIDSKTGHDLVVLNERLIDAGSRAGSPGAYLINMLPILKYWPRFFPGGRFQKEAKDVRLLTHRVLNLPIELVKLGVEKESSFTSLLQLNLDSGDSDKGNKVYRASLAVAATSYGAGTETSTSLILSFFLAMVLFPEVQKEMQKELDDVLQGRLPTYADKLVDQLQCIDALVKECYRWAPPGAFGLPHYATKNDVIDGYLIPKGSIVMSNVWGIFYDEKLYPQPSEFRPARFLGNQPQLDPRDHAYGYGRRICPGRGFAEGTLWITFAYVLTCFDILPALDSAGNPQLPDIAYTSGVMRRPKEFRCRIIPRSPLVNDLII